MKNVAYKIVLESKTNVVRMKSLIQNTDEVSDMVFREYDSLAENMAALLVFMRQAKIKLNTNQIIVV